MESDVLHEIMDAQRPSGSRVTVVDALDRIAALEEPEISEAMTGVLRGEGIEVATPAQVMRVEPGSPKPVVAIVDGAECRIEADEILVATGRRPMLSRLDLDRAGVEVDERGMLVLDEHLRTTNPRVFAAGDVTGAPQFVYVAAAQCTVAADNALTGADTPLDYVALPRVTFTTPVDRGRGGTDEEAQRAGFACECRVMGLEHVPRARVNLETEGCSRSLRTMRALACSGVHVLASETPVRDPRGGVRREVWAHCRRSRKHVGAVSHDVGGPEARLAGVHARAVEALMLCGLRGETAA